MASNLVVVAIPSQDDSVWQVSSEKAPHLTILFLGDAMSNPNVSKIVDYVKEQAQSTRAVQPSRRSSRIPR